MNGYRELPCPPPPERSYKAAPREGVWATGPFLHNASVPNLYEMLIPASQRSKTFKLGRDFDPVKVGIDTSGASGSQIFDTAAARAIPTPATRSRTASAATASSGRC